MPLKEKSRIRIRIRIQIQIRNPLYRSKGLDLSQDVRDPEHCWEETFSNADVPTFFTGGFRK
jgi:hypothetical protein